MRLETLETAIKQVVIAGEKVDLIITMMQSKYMYELLRESKFRS